MSKMREAWEYWNMTLEDNWPYTEEAFEAGFQAAIAAVKEGGPVGYQSPLRYGSQLTFPKPNPPPEWDDFYNDWFCIPLYKLPEDEK